MDRAMQRQLHVRAGALLCALAVLLLPTATACGAGPGMPDVRTGDYSTVAAYFEQAKKNESELIAFLHKMPKGADLHNHPGGAIYGESVVDSAVSNDFLFDRQEKAFIEMSADLLAASRDRYFSSRDIVGDFWKTCEVLDGLAMRNFEKQEEVRATHFFRAFDRYGKARPEKDAQFDELIRRAISQRIGYMELMTTPPGFETSADVEAYKHFQASLDQRVAGILNSDEYRDISPDLSLDIAFTLTLSRGTMPKNAIGKGFVFKKDAGGFGITITPGWESYLAKSGDFADAYGKSFRADVRSAMERVQALRKGESASGDLRVYGITILSAEDSWISRHFFDMQMQIISDERHDQSRNMGGLYFNLHAGELTLEYSPYEPLRNRISRTIEWGGAKRIGHGISIAWEDNTYDLLQKMRKEKIAVEICLTSNEKILDVHGREGHPFMLYMRAGVPMVLCTDDEGISRSNLTMEFAKAAKWFGLSYGQMKWLAFNSLEYSFLPGESLFEDGDYNRKKSVIPAGSKKAAKQVQLLRAFRNFEQRMAREVRETFVL